MLKRNNKIAAFEFTLVELLVVISIIAVLAAMLLPVLKNARASGNTIACMGNMRQVGGAIHMYTMDFSGYYPHYADGTIWIDKLIAQQYTKLEVFKCKALKAPQNFSTETSYGYNYYGAGSNFSSSDSNSALTNYCNSGRVKKPSSFYILMDAVNSLSDTKGAYRIAPYYYSSVSVGNPHVRHGAGLNALYGDCHSSIITVPPPGNALVAPGAYPVLNEKGTFVPY